MTPHRSGPEEASVLSRLSHRGGDRDCLAAPGRIDDAHADRLALVEMGDACRVERGNVDENVLAAVIGLDEAVAFCCVVEFYVL